MVRAGEPAQLAAQDEDGHVCKAVGPVPEQALVHSLTADDLESRLKKTGGTPYYCAMVRSVVDPGLMLPASAINAMRREVLAELTARRGRGFQ